MREELHPLPFIHMMGGSIDMEWLRLRSSFCTYTSAFSSNPVGMRGKDFKFYRLKSRLEMCSRHSIRSKIHNY